MNRLNSNEPQIKRVLHVVLSKGLFLVSALLFTSCAGTQSTVSTTQQPHEPSETESIHSEETETDAELNEGMITISAEEFQELEALYRQQANNLLNAYVTAQQHFFNGNVQTALQITDEAMQIAPNAQILLLQAAIYMSLGGVEKANELRRQALQLDPELQVIPDSAQGQDHLEQNR